MELLYKDEHIVVCIKPSGILSCKDASGRANMTDTLAFELGCKDIYPIHRLDKEVSGVMVFALTAEAAAGLSVDASNHNRFKKEYMAVVSGGPDENEGTFEDLLFKDSAKNKSYVVKKMRRGVKQAKLEYSVVERLDDKTIVKVRLFTGRTHQIRVQFASRGMALVGDRKYGGIHSEKGIALCSVALEFIHPISKQPMSFKRLPELNEMI